MSLDPALLAEARAWFTKAAEDLRAGEFERHADPPLAFDIVFHAQQAAEKALKGFLTWHRRTFRKTHNLVEIGEACAAIEPELEPLLRQAAPLTEYAWRFRYPGELEAPTSAEAESALNLAREVYEASLAKLPRELHP